MGPRGAHRSLQGKADLRGLCKLCEGLSSRVSKQASDHRSYSVELHRLGAAGELVWSPGAKHIHKGTRGDADTHYGHSASPPPGHLSAWKVRRSSGSNSGFLTGLEQHRNYDSARLVRIAGSSPHGKRAVHRRRGGRGQGSPGQALRCALWS